MEFCLNYVWRDFDANDSMIVIRQSIDRIDTTILQNETSSQS